MWVAAEVEVHVIWGWGGGRGGGGVAGLGSGEGVHSGLDGLAETTWGQVGVEGRL